MHLFTIFYVHGVNAHEYCILAHFCSLGDTSYAKSNFKQRCTVCYIKHSVLVFMTYTVGLNVADY